MGQAITDYGKFLAEAREAVDSLNCDQTHMISWRQSEIRLERGVGETAKKAVADNISQTTRKRRMRSAPIMIRKSGRVRSA